MKAHSDLMALYCNDVFRASRETKGKTMNNEITIKTRPVGMSTEVRGFVGTHEVMSMNSRPSGEWTVGSSSCLPTDPGRAALYVECMNRVIARAREYGAP